MDRGAVGQPERPRPHQERGPTLSVIVAHPRIDPNRVGRTALGWPKRDYRDHATACNVGTTVWEYLKRAGETMLRGSKIGSGMNRALILEYECLLLSDYSMDPTPLPQSRL